MQLQDERCVAYHIICFAKYHLFGRLCAKVFDSLDVVLPWCYLVMFASHILAVKVCEILCWWTI